MRKKNIYIYYCTITRQIWTVTTSGWDVDQNSRLYWRELRNLMLNHAFIVFRCESMRRSHYNNNVRLPSVTVIPSVCDETSLQHKNVSSEAGTWLTRRISSSRFWLWSVSALAIWWINGSASTVVPQLHLLWVLQRPDGTTITRLQMHRAARARREV